MYVDRFLPRLARLSTAASYSEKQGVTSAREDRQVQFYKEPHRKVGEEYDGSALKKYDKSLNTTLIFVSSSWILDEPVLIRIAGQSVLGRHHCLHCKDRL